MGLVFFIIKLMSFILFCKSQIISPIFGEKQFNENILNLISSANKSIHATIYKFNNNNFIDTFRQLGNSGVQLNLYCDKESFDTCNKFFKFGNIEKFSMKSYSKLHAKSILIDQQILILGSFNLDNSGFSSNMEIGVVLRDDNLIYEYKLFLQNLKNNQ